MYVIGGTWVGSLTAFWAKQVATWAGSDSADDVITEIDIVCWDEDGWNATPERRFRLLLPRGELATCFDLRIYPTS